KVSRVGIQETRVKEPLALFENDCTHPGRKRTSRPQGNLHHRTRSDRSPKVRMARCCVDSGGMGENFVLVQSQRSMKNRWIVSSPQFDLVHLGGKPGGSPVAIARRAIDDPGYSLSPDGKLD